MFSSSRKIVLAFMLLTVAAIVAGTISTSTPVNQLPKLTPAPTREIYGALIAESGTQIHVAKVTIVSSNGLATIQLGTVLAADGAVVFAIKDTSNVCGNSTG